MVLYNNWDSLEDTDKMDDAVTYMLNCTLQNLQKQREKKEEENLTLWDRMTDMARRGELADIMPQGNPSTYRREQPKIGRNDPCPCGSGKKYKNCCGR